METEIGDTNDYPAIFMAYNYIMSKRRSWRKSGGGRSIAQQDNELALMQGVIPQPGEFQSPGVGSRRRAHEGATRGRRSAGG